MPSFTEAAKEKQRIKDLYDLAKNKGGTTWELNFLRSIQQVIDGTRPLTPSMDEKLQELASLDSSKGESDGDSDGTED